MSITAVCVPRRIVPCDGAPAVIDVHFRTLLAYPETFLNIVTPRMSRIRKMTTKM